MVRCGTCKRELKDEAQRFCNECSRGFGKKPGRAHRHHREELRRDGGAGAVARV